MVAELLEDLANIRKLTQKTVKELASLQGIYKNICEHNDYLRQQLDTYKVYLMNVRSQAGTITTLQKGKHAKTAPTQVGGGAARTTQKATGPFRYGHVQLEKDGVIVESDVPENRRQNIYFNFSSPSPGTFLIALHYKGRDKAILEMQLKLDDLLEKQHDNRQLLDLEYVQLNVNKTLHLLNKTFL
eukprot:Colp12_sorted_trinity150504_noHs@8572